MAERKQNQVQDAGAEQKLRAAARKLFTRKGFAATRTRDIAEEAGLNLALLNYYFGSKQKLFDIIMLESLRQFMVAMHGELNNPSNSLESKVGLIASNYIDLLKANPDLPLFVMSELRANPKQFAASMNLKGIVMKSRFVQQLREANAAVDPLQFIMNIIGLCVFPFVACPLLMVVGDIKQPGFDRMMEARKELIPVWVEAMLKTKTG